MAFLIQMSLNKMFPMLCIRYTTVNMDVDAIEKKNDTNIARLQRVRAYTVQMHNQMTNLK